MGTLNLNAIDDYTTKGEVLKVLWKNSLKKGAKLLVGIDGKNPDGVVSGVRYRKRFGDYQFKAGAMWYDINGAPWGFRTISGYSN